MCAVARRDVIALQMEGDITEGQGVAVNIEGADGGGRVGAIFFGFFKLAEKVLGEVGRSFIQEVLLVYSSYCSWGELGMV